MQKKKWSYLKLIKRKSFTYLFSKYITVHTNAQNIRKLEVINQKLSIG